MAEQPEWDVLSQRMIAEGRARPGEPPTAEEVDALFEGTLSEEEAAGARARLIHYPEMVRVMTQEPPPENVRVLSDDERRADWAAIQKRIAPSAPVPIRTKPRYWPYAAAAALTLAALSIVNVASRSRSTPHEPPLVARRIERRALRPDAILRGGESSPAVALAAADDYVLQLLTSSEVHDDSYRVEIVDTQTSRVSWTRSGLRGSRSGAFEIAVPGTVLQPGERYQIDLYKASQRVATYTVRVLTT
jgi:hypothetical protein